MRIVFGVAALCLVQALLVAQEDVPPALRSGGQDTASSSETSGEAVPGTAAEEEVPEARQVVLDRRLSVRSLGMKYRMANDWTVRQDELGARRIYAEGPIEFGLQTTLSVWIVSNPTVFQEFLKSFRDFLVSSYPAFSCSDPVETSVGGYRAATIRLEGALTGEGDITVPCVYAFTAVDLDQYKLIIMLVWPKAEDEFYSQFNREFLGSVDISGPILYRRRDGYVEVDKYLLKPLPDWSVEFVRADKAAKDARDKVVFTAPTGNRLEFLLEERRDITPLDVFARQRYEEKKRLGATSYKKVHDGLYEIILDAKAGGVEYRVAEFCSGVTGELLVVKLMVPAGQWDKVGKYAEELGRHIALRSAPTALFFEKNKEESPKVPGDG